MQAQDIMIPTPLVCNSWHTLTEVAEILLEKHLYGLPVVDEQGLFVGYIGHRQLYKAISQKIDVQTPVQKLMNSNVMTVSPDTDLKTLYPLRNTVMPVLKNGKLFGVITRELVAAYSNLEANSFSPQDQAIFDAEYEGIIIINNNQQILVYNKAAENILGLKRDAVLNQLYSDVFPQGNLYRVIEKKQGIANEKFVHNNKTYLSINNPIILAGNLIGAIAIIQDISALESITSELEYTKKVKAELDAIIEASFDSIFVTDAKANVVSINEAYTRITGIKAEDIIGKNMYDLVEQGLYDRSATISVIETHQMITFTQTLKSGKTLLVTGNPVFNKQGELAWVITNGRDITELMSLKQEVELAQNLSRHYEKELQKVIMQSGEMIVNSPKTKELLELTMRLGTVDSTVLIYGESGVGKELIARELHKNSNRKDKPMININCAAIPETLLESELFGYESGAFSGARKGGKMGIFELANGGTLFLDEIGEMSLTLQSKLLRAIQEKEILRIGATTPIKIDVRLITATNRDLWEMTRRGQFRQDLYYRLNVVPIYVPPLRERKEEIPALTYHFLNLFNKQYGMNKKIDERIIANLLDYDWPGNVRELKNAIERAVVTSTDEVIKSIKIGGTINDSEMEFNLENEITGEIDLREKVNAYEKDLLQRYIQNYKSSRKVAKALNVSQTTVVRKAAQYGIPLEG
ncbi:MAG: sigma 54-interacting transcriptional regulator [Syntrophomonadaceae bacterium]|mgnify:CR=1 FL=1|nr:sigma 54-interacting transcriptional regulator [Syntrophomonadaceae bacterium]